MEYSELFSKRYSLRPTPEGLMYEDVPERARVGLYHVVEQFFHQEHRVAYLELYNRICVALRIPRKRMLDDYHASIAIEGLIRTCEWWQFYDICEVMWSTLEYPWGNRDELSEQVNTVLREEQLGFEIREGKIEKVGSGFIDAKVKEARYLLKEPEFKGADQHFEKAIKAINIRPNPDVENCIKDAVAAIESVGRIITNDENALLDDIIKKAVRKGVIPQPLDQTFTKLYAYRGSEPGVAHGAVDISKVTVDEAELILAMSAAMIIYLVKRGVCFDH
ncbi:AbiJ-NTD4 domain-containing protein [Chloroflexota bacterium]